MPGADHPVVVVGAGPAGLATSAELSRRGVPHRVLERGERAGHTWENLYESLRLHTGRHMSILPGMRFPRGTPLFPTRADFVDYLHAYAERFRVPVTASCEVRSATRTGGAWELATSEGTLTARVLVAATGIVANPRVPSLAGQERFAGRVMHSVEYRRPDPFRGRRVLVVGVGNSGGEIASELAAAGVDVAVSVRTGANVVPLTLAGIPIQYHSYLLRRLPRRAQEAVSAAVQRLSAMRRGPPVLPVPGYSPLDRIPLIGFHLVDAVRAGAVRVHGGILSLTGSGARFADGAEEPFDDVILATGFDAAVRWLGDQIGLDERGFARRTDRVVSTDRPDLYVVGHNYDATGGLFNIRRDAPAAAERIARALG